MSETNPSRHIPVLLNEVIESLNLRNGQVVLDSTYGGGGHSAEILKKFPGIRLITIDQDKSTKAQYHLNFRELGKALAREGVTEVDAIIFDLGLSSDQLENSGLGFSFAKDEPLSMAMNSEADITAETIVNRWSEENLADIIYGYGGERRARTIAKAIVRARAKAPIKTTRELVAIIEGVAKRTGKIHPATKTFQALRIAVNDELRALKEGLAEGFNALKRGGRIAVISFNSLEDRIVKNFNKEKVKSGQGKLINNLPTGKAGKPIRPSREELKENPRSRSAKLRIIAKNHS